MFFSNISSNGFESEGIGSVMSFKLMSYGIARALNRKFVDNRFENILGYTYENLNIEEFSKELNEKFNFEYKNKDKDQKSAPFDIFFDYPSKPKLGQLETYKMRKKRDLFWWLFKRFNSEIAENRFITELLDNRDFNNREIYYKDGINIAIHLRAPRQDLDIRFESSRNLYYGSYSDIDRVNNIIRQLEHSEKLRKINFHIVSAGPEKFYSKFDTLFDRNEIHLHLDKNIYDSFDILAYSDLLVLSGSGLSYSAHLLNKNISLLPYNMHYGKRVHYDNAINLDQRGLLTRLNYIDKLI